MISRMSFLKGAEVCSELCVSGESNKVKDLKDVFRTLHGKLKIRDFSYLKEKKAFFIDCPALKQKKILINKLYWYSCFPLLVN